MTHEPQDLDAYEDVKLRAYRKGQQDMLVKCIAAIEAITEDMKSSTEWDRDYDVDPSGNTRNPRIWIREAINSIENIIK